MIGKGAPTIGTKPSTIDILIATYTKNEAAKAKQNSATANALKKLRKQHEEERDEAMGEFSKYKDEIMYKIMYTIMSSL